MVGLRAQVLDSLLKVRLGGFGHIMSLYLFGGGAHHGPAVESSNCAVAEQLAGGDGFVVGLVHGLRSSSHLNQL